MHTTRNITRLAALLIVLLLVPAASASAHTKAPKPCVVPKVIGQTLPVARRHIDRAHCAVGKVKRPKIASGALVVGSQSRKAHRRLRHGTKINLTLKVKPAKAATVSTPAPTVAAPAVVRASLDPQYTQNQDNPLIVSWAYDAGVDDGTLPDGTLSLTVYEHGQVASAGGCTIDVGGTITGGTCTLTLPQYGAFDVTVSYASSSQSVAPSTSTDTETIEPFPVTNTFTWGTDSPTQGAYVQSVLVGDQASVTVGDPNFEGATSVNLTDSTGAQCTADVSGITATCTMTDIATPTSYTLSYPGGTTTTSSVDVDDNGVESVTDEWPATVVQINNPQVTIQEVTVTECGGSASSASWNAGTGCSTPGVANPWPSTLTVATGSYVFLYATAYGSLPDDFNPGLYDGSVEGYLDWSINGGVEGTDYHDWNFMEGDDNAADCSRMDLQSETNGIYGPDEPTGYCEFDFLTPGQYTISVGYVSEDPDYADQPDGPSITITAVS